MTQHTDTARALIAALARYKGCRKSLGMGRADARLGYTISNQADPLIAMAEAVIAGEHAMEVAWMIERRSIIGSDSSAPLWYDGRHFSPLANCGLRFARKKDAERVIETFGLMHAYPTEHGWCTATAKEPTNGE